MAEKKRRNGEQRDLRFNIKLRTEEEIALYQETNLIAAQQTVIRKHKVFQRDIVFEGLRLIVAQYRKKNGPT